MARHRRCCAWAMARASVPGKQPRHAVAFAPRRGVCPSTPETRAPRGMREEPPTRRRRVYVRPKYATWLQPQSYPAHSVHVARYYYSMEPITECTNVDRRVRGPADAPRVSMCSQSMCKLSLAAAADGQPLTRGGGAVRSRSSCGRTRGTAATGAYSDASSKSSACRHPRPHAMNRIIQGGGDCWRRGHAQVRWQLWTQVRPGNAFRPVRRGLLTRSRSFAMLSSTMDAIGRGARAALMPPSYERPHT